MNASRKIVAFIAVGALAGPMAATAAAVTYVFTGTVTTASGIYSSAGSTISGTYTIDLAAGDPAQSQGTVGSGDWVVRALGGSAFGTPLPTGVVLSSTLSTGGVTYSSPPIGGVGFDTFVQAYSDSSDATYQAREFAFASPNSLVTHLFDLVGGTGTNAPVDSAGLPVFSNAVTATGGLFSQLNGAGDGMLLYQITSMTPAVPLPAAAWLLLSGLGGLGVLGRRRKAV